MKRNSGWFQAIAEPRPRRHELPLRTRYGTRYWARTACAPEHSNQTLALLPRFGVITCISGRARSLAAGCLNRGRAALQKV